jgi:DNA-binding transcriptional MocR family regulator
MATPPPAAVATRRYRQTAAWLVQSIENGAFAAGERLPSVREVCRRQDVSLTTALAAYRLLEREGWVVARAKSGYFVSTRPASPPEVEHASCGAAAQLVGVSALVNKILAAGRAPGAVPLSAAYPDPTLFPAARLRAIAQTILRNRPECFTTYPLNPAGLPELRRQIARRAAENGYRVSPEEIIITHGCTEALSLALRAVTRPGDTVAIESPAYYGLLQILEGLGLRALEIPTHPRDGVVVEALELASRTPGAVTACLFVPNFSNPLGSVMPATHKQALVELLAQRGIPLIEDDIYGDLHFDGTRPYPAKRWDTSGQILLCSSFTKTLAPGLRVGWVAAGRYTALVEKLKFQSTLSNAELPQRILVEYLQSGGYERHLRSLREKFRHQMDVMQWAVARYFPPGTRTTRPSGGFVLWVELPAAIDSEVLARLTMADNIPVAPGVVFSSQPKFRNCIRLNCGLVWNAQLEAAIKRIGEHAAAMLDKRIHPTQNAPQVTI